MVFRRDLGANKYVKRMRKGEAKWLNENRGLGCATGDRNDDEVPQLRRDPNDEGDGCEGRGDGRVGRTERGGLGDFIDAEWRLWSCGIMLIHARAERLLQAVSSRALS